MRVAVEVVIKYETEVRDDPESYEGANTPDARLAKEKEYIEEGGSYLVEGLSCVEHSIVATVSPIKNPCGQCGTETGSDAMMFCSHECQNKWRLAEALRVANERAGEAA